MKGVSEAISLSGKSSSAFEEMIVEGTIDLEDFISGYLKKEGDYSAMVYGPVDIAMAKYQIEKYGKVITKAYELETRKDKPFIIWVIDTSASISDTELEAMANIVSELGRKINDQYIVAFSNDAYYTKIEGKKSKDEILKIITELAIKSGRGGTSIETAFTAVKEILKDENTRKNVFFLVILSDYVFGKLDKKELDISEYTSSFRKSIAILLNVGNEDEMKKFMYAIYYEFTDVEAFDVIIVKNRVRLLPSLT